MPLRGRPRAARPSPRVDRTRLPATAALDGWPSPPGPQGPEATEPGVQADSSAITALTWANALDGAVVRPAGLPALTCGFPRVPVGVCTGCARVCWGSQARARQLTTLRCANRAGPWTAGRRSTARDWARRGTQARTLGGARPLGGNALRACGGWGATAGERPGGGDARLGRRLESPAGAENKGWSCRTPCELRGFARRDHVGTSTEDACRLMS